MGDMTTTQISTTARRIARAHNAHIGNLSGGKLVFDSEGKGGAWYSANSYGFGDDCIVVTVGWHRMTEAEAQAIVDYDSADRDYYDEIGR